VLPERIGLNNAKYLLFTGDALPARRLMEMGLVQEVVADDELAARLQTFGEKLAVKSPLVLRRMKSVANQSMEMSQSGALQLELETLRNHFRSDDIKEGLAAFAEKRKPVFTGQ
jgi:enoyl-CoA hydratase/carnithine racemase